MGYVTDNPDRRFTEHKEALLLIGKAVERILDRNSKPVLFKVSSGRGLNQKLKQCGVIPAGDGLYSATPEKILEWAKSVGLTTFDAQDIVEARNQLL